MKISIVVPAFNAERYLRQCLSSIINQSVPCEIVLVDDGSTDDTLKIAEAYDCKIYQHERNKGIGAARLSGSRYATGDYIGFLSADDAYHPCYLDLMSRQIRSKDILLFCNYWRCNEALEPQSAFIAPRYKDQEGLRKLIVEWALNQNMFINFSTVLLSRKVFNHVQFCQDLRYGEDLVFLLETIKAGFTWSHSDLPLVYYRVHEEAGTFKGWNPHYRANLWRHLMPLLKELHVTKEEIERAIQKAKQLSVRKKRKRIIPPALKRLYWAFRQRIL